MPHYEFMTIASMAASANHLTSLFRSLTRTIQSQGGVLRRIENLGLRPLAYRIRAHRKYNIIGRFIRFSVQANPVLMREIERALKNDEEIVRSLVVKRPLVPPNELFHPTEFDPKSDGKHAEDRASIKEREESRALVDYYAAKTLLSAGLLSKEDLSRLPRHSSDSLWDSRVQKLNEQVSEQTAQEIRKLDEKLTIDQIQMKERVEEESKLVEQLQLKEQEKMESKRKQREEFRSLENQRAIYRFWTYTLIGLMNKVKKVLKKEFDELQADGKRLNEQQKIERINERFQLDARTALKKFDDKGIEAILALTKNEPNPLTTLTGINADNFTWKRRTEETLQTSTTSAVPPSSATASSTA
jgi:ribosomal protein S6